MADTPRIFRGQMYNTRRAHRCPNYDQCEMCKQCRSYNKHNALCVWCESGKNPELLCHHTDEQIKGHQLIQLMFKRPMSHIDDREIPAEKNEKGLHNEAALMTAEHALGKIGIADARQF